MLPMPCRQTDRQSQFATLHLQSAGGIFNISVPFSHVFFSLFHRVGQKSDAPFSSCTLFEQLFMSKMASHSSGFGKSVMISSSILLSPTLSIGFSSFPSL
jgi:hypothetical protein